MYGLFFEDINYAADGGLYAEMIENRSFESMKGDGTGKVTYDGLYGWSKYPSGGTDGLILKSDGGLNESNTHHLSVSSGTKLKNQAYDGVYMEAGKTYNVSAYVKIPMKTDKVTDVKVQIFNGSEMVAESVLAKNVSEEWTKYETTITPSKTVRNADFIISVGDLNGVDIDMISCMPTDAICGVFRRDLAEKLKAINPGFLRFPGGCIIEGYNIENRYNWKDTVGKPEERKQNWSRWSSHTNNGLDNGFKHYNQTYGLGFYEYFILCEYLACDAVPVVNVGLACEYNSSETVPVFESDGKTYTENVFNGYLAVYDSNGVLKSVKKTESFGEGNQSLYVILPDDENYLCKAFLWDDMKPVCDAKEKYINEKSGFADTSNVSLTLNSTFEKSEQTGMEYVKSIDVDRLIAPSFEMHGLSAPNNAQRYGGWERKGANNWGTSADTFTLAGHSLGHWMSAAAVLYRDTGDEEILEKLNYVVNQLDYLQTTTNSPYIGGCKEDCFIKLFGGNTSSWANGYWVPWYGVHKIYQGLVDAYIYTENEKAFTVLKKFADWAVDGTSNLTDAQMQTMLNVEYGGMNEIFALMYEFTGEEKYLDTARRFTHDSILNPLISGKDSLTGLHANTQIPKIIGTAEMYEQNPDKYANYRKASENFWNFVVNNRSYAIGGNSISEHFEKEGAETLGVKTCESCNTYNMMRLTEHLFSWNHDSAYMDWYEDALYNHILGQQEPETGAKMYFVSLLQGHHRVYEIKDESWWCCTGTGMENPGRYTRCTYYEDNDDLYVNLYMPNTYTWKNKNLTFKTETEYPYEDSVKMSVTDGSGYAAIKFRSPKWLAEPMTVEVDGKCYTSNGGEYLTVERYWNTGDVINITIPMSVRTYYSREDNKIAYKYGPITLAAPLGSVEGVNGLEEYISNETTIDTKTAVVPYIITNNANPEDVIELTDESTLTFTIKAENNSGGSDITLVPFYSVHHQFYTVYWNINTEMDPFEKALNDVTIDKVEPDGQQDEIGHNKQTNTSGSNHQGSFTG